MLDVVDLQVMAAGLEYLLGKQLIILCAVISTNTVSMMSLTATYQHKP